MTTPEPYAAALSITEAAERLGTSERFIRNRIAKGDLRAYKLKGSPLLRIEPADLEALKVPGAQAD
jgi:excisionase family DNA binding protein